MDAISSAFPATSRTPFMIRPLLVRGMLAGILAGFIVFCMARWLGEPKVERAIAFETSLDRGRGEAPEPEMVSRKVQSGLGLLTGVVVYGTALGGIFGLVFACAQGRYEVSGPRQLAAAIAGLGYVAVVLVPGLKYPANPPSVGSLETIGVRTSAYFLLIALSIAAVTTILTLRRRLALRFGDWNGGVMAGLVYLAIMILVSKLFPSIDEVPGGFPASLLWRFRIASYELQAVLWGGLGLIFGWLTERAQGSYGAR
jgi:predicted cobalt transporter CbtA